MKTKIYLANIFIFFVVFFLINNIYSQNNLTNEFDQNIIKLIDNIHNWEFDLALKNTERLCWPFQKSQKAIFINR